MVSRSSICQTVKIAVSISLYLCAYIIDSLVARQVYHIRRDDPKPGHVIVGFIAVPSIICNLTLAYYIACNFAEKRLFKILVWLCALCQILPLFWMFWACYSVVKGHSESLRMVKYSVYLKLAQACMEGFPQVSMQSTLILRIMQINLKEISSNHTVTNNSITLETATLPHSHINCPQLVLNCMLISFVITCYSFVDYYITILNKPDEELDEAEGDKVEDQTDECCKSEDIKAAAILTVTVSLSLGSRLYICGLLATYISGLWTVPMISAVVVGYIYWRTCEDGGHVGSLMFSLINAIINCSYKSSLPATLSYFLISAVTFACDHTNVLCIAGLCVTTTVLGVNILLATIFSKHV